MGQRIHFDKEFSVAEYTATPLESMIEEGLRTLGVTLGIPEVRGAFVKRIQTELIETCDPRLVYVRQPDTEDLDYFAPSLTGFLKLLRAGRFVERIVIQPGFIISYDMIEPGHPG